MCVRASARAYMRACECAGDRGRLRADVCACVRVHGPSEEMYVRLRMDASVSACVLAYLSSLADGCVCACRCAGDRGRVYVRAHECAGDHGRVYVRARACAIEDGCECECLGACVRVGAHAYSRACRCAGDRGLELV